MKKILLICAAVIISAATMSAQDMAKATETYNNAANTLQTDKVAALGMFQQALKMGEACGADGAELVTNCKNAIPGVILSIGKELYNNKDIAGALTKFQEAAKVAKEYGNTDVATEAGDLISHATTLKDMEDGKAAMESVRTAKTATDATKGYTQAITSFKKVMAADTTNAAAALYLGQALSATGDINGAVEAFKHAAANGQENIAKTQIANLYLKTAAGALKTGRYADAIANAEKSNEIEQDAQAYLVIGQANQKLAKNDDAIAAFEKYIDMKPTAKNADAIRFTVAALYQKSGNKAKAIEFYKKVLTNPQFGASAKQQVDALSK